MTTAHNPILSGFYPDPSICAVGRDFYLVCSTFAYFPGLPVFHSTDLTHWEQIGNALDRPEQLDLEGCRHSQGIYAPTIRYHEGTFYLITTYSSGPGSFVLTAKDPAGPWSDPYWLGEDAPGIDPSLFFDDDGRCYYVGTRPNPAGVRYNGDWEIWAQELDLATMRLTGQSHALWKGAMNGVIWPEGPHLYKHEGRYYLMHAEGGTGPDHCVCVARADEVFGPYTGNPDNPILTHRHLGRDYPVTCAGHGDLVQAEDGSWYMVLLACRPRSGHTLLGRETFLAKVRWESGWPVANPGVGRLEDTLELPFAEQEVLPAPPVYTFPGPGLPPEFLTLRAPAAGTFVPDPADGSLTVRLLPATLKELSAPAYLGLRWQHHRFQAMLAMEFEPAAPNACAGLALVQNNTNHLRLEKCRGESGPALRLILCENGTDRILASTPLPDGRLELRAVVRDLQARLYWRTAGSWQPLGDAVDLRCLSTESAGGFTGCTAGLYASSNGEPSRETARFAWFACQKID